jgi:hypothetical protein
MILHVIFLLLLTASAAWLVLLGLVVRDDE